jgi:uncharacterized membrane protein
MAIMVVLSVLLFYGGDGLLFNTIIKKKMIWNSTLLIIEKQGQFIKVTILLRRQLDQNTLL